LQPEISRHGEGDNRVGANADFGPFFSPGGMCSKCQSFLPDGLTNNVSPLPSRSIYSIFCGLAAAISVFVREFYKLGMFLNLVFFSVLTTRCKTRDRMLKIQTEIMTTHGTKKPAGLAPCGLLGLHRMTLVITDGEFWWSWRELNPRLYLSNLL